MTKRRTNPGTKRTPFPPFAPPARKPTKPQPPKTQPLPPAVPVDPTGAPIYPNYVPLVPGQVPPGTPPIVNPPTGVPTQQPK